MPWCLPNFFLDLLLPNVYFRFELMQLLPQEPNGNTSMKVGARRAERRKNWKPEGWVAVGYIILVCHKWKVPSTMLNIIF